jgi:acyl carrier protein
MKTVEFLREIESAIELPPYTLTGSELLLDIPEWDSLAVISFIAVVDEKLNLPIDGEAIANAVTVHDLLVLARAGLEDFDAAA